MMKLMIGINRYLRRGGAAAVRAQIELIHYTFEERGFKGSLQMVFGKILRLGDVDPRAERGYGDSISRGQALVGHGDLYYK